MPIMAVYEQSDARGTARVIASAAKKCIDGAELGPRYVASLNNLFRLIRAYRTHRFAGFDYEPRSDRGPEAFTLLPTVDRHVVDLRVALDEALHETYGQVDMEDALNSVENVLRSTAYPAGQPDEAAARARVSSFLGTFIDHLHASR